MDLICRCAGQSAIYEDGDYWVTTDYDGKNPEQVLKSERPYYPLSAVTKYDADPVNIKRLEELGEKLGKTLDEEKNDRPINN